MRFDIDGRELIAVVFAEEDEDELLAIYHSHTRSAPYPSQTDVNFAAGWPGVEWLIVRVAGAMNQAEAEFVQGMLLEEGIPSTLRRRRGFDVPDMFAAGPRDVMVPASGHGAARDVLLEAEIVRDEPVAETPPSRVLAVLMGALAIGALVIWLGTELGG